MKRLAVIGAVLENPRQSQNAFNDTVSEFRGIVKGRMGIPFEEENAAVIAITLLGELDEINALTGKLGNLSGVTVKAAVSNALTAASAAENAGTAVRKTEGAGGVILKGEKNHV